ncbi:hypothetical protein ACFQ51_21075 [Streptomyces kaempferi]
MTLAVIALSCIAISTAFGIFSRRLPTASEPILSAPLTLEEVTQ